MSTNATAVRIGTRGSALALWQARAAATALQVPCEIRVIETSGDKMLDVPLQGRVEKGFFTKEIEDRLLAGEVDLAVHSLKDLPVEQPPGLAIVAVLPRGPVGDRLLVRPDSLDKGSPFPLLPGSVIGAGSLRRQALTAAFTPGFRTELIRGNVPSRVRKCAEGRYGAVVLAAAGLDRLQADISPLAAYDLDPVRWLCAPAQGVVALQARSDDRLTIGRALAANHAESFQAAAVERGLLASFGGGCHTAFAAHAELVDGLWHVRVGLQADDGRWLATSFSGTWDECLAHGPHTLRDRLAPPDTSQGPPICRRTR